MARRFWQSRRVVSFDENVVLHEYENKEEGPPSRDFFSALDRRRSESTHPSPEEHMASVEYLLKHVCARRPATIVYGNLGRYPVLVSYYLDFLYGREEAVGVRAGGSNVEDCLRSEKSDETTLLPLERDYLDDGKDLHALFWLEPPFGAKIERVPLRARRLVVLTSHPNFETGDALDPCFVAHHVGDAVALDPNLRPQTVPPLARYLSVEEGAAEERFPRVGRFVPDAFYRRRFPIADRRCRVRDLEAVLADAGDCDSASEAYLRLLNARDAMRHYFGPERRTRCWSAILRDDVRDRLVEELERAKETLLALRGKIECNLNGIDVMVAEYVEPFLLPLEPGR